MWCSPFLSILFPVLHRDVAIPFRVVAQGGGRPDVGVSGADRGYQAVFVYGGNAPGVGGPAQGRVQVRVGSCITDDDTQFFDGFHLDEKYGLPDWTEELFTDIG